LSSGGTPTGIAPNQHDVSFEGRRLALNSKKALANVEDQVIALVCDRSKNAYSQAKRCTGDCAFGDRTFLIA
jgi:hypothetical protein